uniref:Uncharacterized protein n=1 Tax=Aegilops tauschii subsp. strangulata TaxID=200361 RepID=A0A453BCB6_AEGTS
MHALNGDSVQVFKLSENLQINTRQLGISTGTGSSSYLGRDSYQCLVFELH